MFSKRISLSTKGFTDIIDITGHVMEAVTGSGLKSGLVTVFVTGSTGAVTSIEYEPGVVSDLKKAIERIAPSDIQYDHDKRWGDGNGFSHVRAALMKPSLSIPLVDGAMTLGAWQQLVFMDFDNRPRDRELVVQVIGQ
jgi:secondary thiamine-phosphate synthase enzyme